MKRALFLCFVFATVAAIPAEAQTQYELKAVHSGKCAHVEAGSLDDGGRISQWACNTNVKGQTDTVRKDFFKWRKIPASGEWFKLQAVHSQKCAQVHKASRENGAPITQWTCVNQTNVHWKQADAGNGVYYIINRASGKCMHVHGGEMNNGALISQWDCVNQPNVKWNVTGSTPMSNPVLVPAR